MSCYYLIECQEDNSFCIVPENEILFDEKIKKLDLVPFFYQKKKFSGKVIDFSDDAEALKKQAKQLRKESKKLKKKEKHLRKTSDEEKITDKKRKSSSCKLDHHGMASVTKKPKLQTKEISHKESKGHHSQSNKEVLALISSGDPATPPNDNGDTPLNLAGTVSNASTSAPSTLKLNESLTSVSSCGNEEIDREDIDNLTDKEEPRDEELGNLNTLPEIGAVGTPPRNTSNDDQLFGKNHSEEMVELLKDCDVYCTRRIFNIMEAGSKKPSNIIRRLMDGVFRPEQLLNCTLTGQPSRKPNERNRVVECLNLKGKNAIVAFMKRKCIENGWDIPAEKEVNNWFTQKIGEIKRDWNKK